MNFEKLFRTNDSPVNLVTRVALALVLLPHGAQKLFGLFGGYGFSGTMGFFTGTMGLPWIVAFLVVMIESVGALMILAGAGTRLAAAGVVALMAGAIQTTHWQHGFFMNWFGNQKGEGFEYHLLVLGIAGALVVWGAGRASVDQRIAGWLAARDREEDHGAGGRVPAAARG